MALSLYDISVPVFIRGLEQLSYLLDKGLAHAQASGIEPSALFDARLAPDMYSLAGQVQRASDASKLGTARAAAITAPSFPDDETSYEQLPGRVAKTIEFLKSVDRKLLDGAEDRPVAMKVGGKELKFTAQSYVLQFAVPNFTFHVVAAYAILRHNGAPVGKLDYLGRFETA